MIFEPKQSRRSKFSARNIQSEAPIELYMPLTVSKNSCILLHSLSTMDIVHKLTSWQPRIQNLPS
jgi:hypothetical protein